MPSDQDILTAILAADEELYKQGEPLLVRRLKSPQLAREKLGMAGLAKGPFEPADQLGARLGYWFERLYGKETLSRGIGHGVVEFRRTPYLVTIPMVFGKAQISPFEHTSMPQLQIEVITRDKRLFSRAIYQIGDAFDT